MISLFISKCARCLLQDVSSAEDKIVVRSSPDGAAGHAVCYDIAVGSHYNLTTAQHLSLIGQFAFVLYFIMWLSY